MEKLIPIELLNLKSKTYDKLKKSGFDCKADLTKINVTNVQRIAQLSDEEMNDLRECMNAFGFKLNEK